MKQQSATLTDNQRRAATMEAQGVPTKDIAARLNVHRVTVFRWRQLDAYKAEVAQVSEDFHRVTRAVLLAGTEAAARRVAALVDSEDERIALAAAQTVLDRTGHPKAERVELSADVRASGSVTVDPSDELAAMLAGGGE